MAKVIVVKLFDTRQPLSLANRGRRSCLCAHQVSQMPSRALHSPSPQIASDKRSESENSSGKENNLIKNINDIQKNFVEDTIDECCLAVKMNGSSSLLSSVDNTSNSMSCNSEENSVISIAENTSNSSWNNTSRESLVESFNEHNYTLMEHSDSKVMNLKLKPLNVQKHASVESSNELKYVRNKFPTVFNKSFYMNLCRSGDNVAIPISYVRNVSKCSTQDPTQQITSTSENSTEYDIDSDRLNTSLVELKNSPSDKISLSSLSQKYSLKYINKNKSIKEDDDTTKEITFHVYISDVHGIEESLILNKDRRFSRIMERYKCTASVVQMNNMSRGFPHTLLKITGSSKMNLQFMSRDTDKIHPQWNLRSQLRSVHA